MPGKARRKRGKYSFQSKGKKRKDRPSRPAALVRQAAVTQAEKPVSAPSVPLPSVSAPTPTVKPALIQYPYISSELRTIGILAGIMLIILIVLALTLS